MQKELIFQNTPYTKYQKQIQELIGFEWYKEIGHIFDSSKMKELSKFVKEERANKTIYPLPQHTFKAFDSIVPKDVKVVIIGQDCYHNGNATGRAFECKKYVSPSLKQIYKSINKTPTKDLSHWVEQGVLLLNCALTVQSGKPMSHYEKWRYFIDNVIKILGKKEDIVWLLWGSKAKRKSRFIKSKYIFKDIHPVAASYNEDFEFLGGLNQANIWLDEIGKEFIKW